MRLPLPEAILIDPLSIGNVAMPVSADFVQQYLLGEKTYVHELNDRPRWWTSRARP